MYNNKRKVTRNNYAIYGVHAVQAVLRYQPERAKRLFIARSKDLDELIFLAKNLGLPVQELDRHSLESRFAVGHEAQGVVLEAEEFAYKNLDWLLKEDVHTLVVLDSWQDSVNIGRAARAALCFGADALLLNRNRCAHIGAAAEKAAVGALARVPVVSVANLAGAFKTLKEHNFFLYGTDEEGTVSIADCDFAEKSIIVIGQEGSGMRELSKRLCDLLVTIPMVNNDICLNAGDTAVLFLYELSMRKLKKRGS
jgi:23S rRNA (guanosine2251-2'-O)-methyltransferase